LIARLLDYRQKETEIIGTVAGDDTIFVVPASTKRIDKTLREVKSLLYRA
jgi:transcriptional regulator of arginine metabolism